MMRYQVGDIEEGSTGPEIVIAIREMSPMSYWRSVEPISGPPTRMQHEQREMNARWEARKLAQEQAYDAMKQEMETYIPQDGEGSGYAREIVDKFCELYSAYCERWETY
jgi:hypothetical protein